MTYTQFYDKLIELSLFAPTDEICKSVLQLQIALDRLTDSDDDVGTELNIELTKLFD